MKTTKIILPFMVWILSVAGAYAQRPDYSKMSAMVRYIAMKQQTACNRNSSGSRNSAVSHNVASHPMSHIYNKVNGNNPTASLCAFVKTTDAAQEALSTHGCKVYARFGNIAIADIPLHRLAALSLSPKVARIEAGIGSRLTLDTTAYCVNAMPAYSGTQLPQAYTGQGVVMGVMDIGFDLTHPNFYDSTMTRYRIKRFWDQLSPDTIGSQMYIGREYTTADDILALQHPFDGLHQTHGTHTTGIAAGGGCGTKYRGIAFDADLCLVNNVTGDDADILDSSLLYRYTYAADALGFKYIFDYAKEVGRPCVINFSEGSYEDFRGDDLLYYEVLDSLCGPGRIIVSSAGNTGHRWNYIHKPVGKESAGVFSVDSDSLLYQTLKSAQPFTAVVKFYYGGEKTVVDIPTDNVLSSADSTYTTSLEVGGDQYVVTMTAYPSCYNVAETVYDLYVYGPSKIGQATPISIEISGRDADVTLYRQTGWYGTNDLDASLCDATNEYGINSPGSSPGIISVGATTYRTHTTNYRGEVQQFDTVTGGLRSYYSSVGPTLDGRIKPDVMAPGTNIISSYSSFYRPNNPTAWDADYDVAYFDWNGRTYIWNAESGTSMASPVVAGAIALWLEADPTLTTADCLDIFRTTCRHPDPALDYPNNEYGYGEIDVYAGLLEVLRRQSTGLQEVVTLPKVARMGCCVKEGRLVLTSAEPVEADFKVAVYSLAGVTKAAAAMAGGSAEYSFDISSLPQGVYVVNIQSVGGSCGNGKIDGALVFLKK